MRFEIKVTREMVNAEVERRITERFPLHRQINAARGSGDEVDFAWIDQVRASGKALKAQDPIPASFKNDRHWPANP